jgi:3-hydroxyisobutyrate dehydrogenase-like beta-hydroxyacid dehydrogenase
MTGCDMTVAAGLIGLGAMGGAMARSFACATLAKRRCTK